MDLYLINLDRNPERLSSSLENFKSIGVDPIRVSAVDGAALSEDEYTQFAVARNRNIHIPWSRGQVGCFLSHYKIWEIAAVSTDPYTAIFEDDLHLSPSLRDFIESDRWIPSNVDIIRLETSTNRVLMDRTALSSLAGRNVYRVRSTAWCAGGYIISRNAARKLLSVLPKDHGPTDHFLFSYEDSDIPKKFITGQVYPALCVQDKFRSISVAASRFGSDISNEEEGKSLSARFRYFFKTPPHKVIMRTILGYKRIPYLA